MKLVTAMIMRNEANRYLDEVLSKAKEYSDKIVILDDNSDDNSVEVAEKHKAQVYAHEDEPLFWREEHSLREYLWKEILPREAEPGDWVLALDCDEILGEQFLFSKEMMLRQETVGTYSFQLFEAWGSRDKIRIDKYWNPRGKETPLLTRFEPSVNYIFPKIGLHCGRLPMNSLTPVVPSGCSLLHLGWSNPDEHEEKIERYLKNDPSPHPQMVEHYKSMREPPELMEWFL
jgi:glycosyltransferase involved in cell wall biosynthesis